MASVSRVKRVKDWRKKESNKAKLKYSRDLILSMYLASEVPALVVPDNLISNQSLPPILQGVEKVSCQNSRKPGKVKKREKSVNYKIAICQTTPDENLETEEQPGKSLSLSFIDDKKEIFESYVKYPEGLFNSFIAKNPFAEVINLNCSRNAGNVFPLNKSFERIWFYKDLLGKTQGPFSSVEMFNWTAAGYFTSHLMIARGEKSQFFALRAFN
jgi:hypothetical protein